MLLFPAVLRYQPLSVDFSRSGIWGKLGTGVQGICLKNCAKFPPITLCAQEMQPDYQTPALWACVRGLVTTFLFSLSSLNFERGCYYLNPSR